MHLRILIVTQSFPPEMGALPSRMYPIARELASAGHSVFVATCMPNYPQGIVFDGFRTKWRTREKVENYTVLRTWSYCVPRNISRVRQLLSYMSFVPSVFWSGLQAGPIDVVFVTSPPIFPSISGAALAWLRRAKLVLDIRDLWPDEIVACGELDEGSLPFRILSRLERALYRKADCICCTTRSFMRTIEQRHAEPENLVYLPNGADTDLFRPHGHKDEHRPRELKDKFVVLFSGILGIKQGLSTLLATAKLLQREADIVFHLVGAGSRLTQLKEHAAALGLENVIFSGERKLSDVPALIRSADVCVSLLMPDPYLQKIVSVKIYEYLACGKPVIGAHEGESARVIRESGAGLVVAPADPQALADAILKLRSDPVLRNSFAQAGRSWVEQHHSRARIAQRLERILRHLVEWGGLSSEDKLEVETMPIEKLAATALTRISA
jgi:glycosyltransferase involved in cell wall biosynthesis